MISDLRTPTPFTITNTIFGVTNCATAPESDSVLLTAFFGTNTYVAYTVAVLSASPTVYATWVFTDLTVTSLTQGQVITMVYKYILLLGLMIDTLGPISRQ